MNISVKPVKREKGWEMGEVARRAGISTHYYRLYEAEECQPRHGMLVRLAKALEVKLGTLFLGI